MKHLKTFEALKDYPSIGDYVCTYQDVNEYGDNYIDIIDFMNNNIGRVINYKFSYNNKLVAIIVEYDYIPEKVKNYFIGYSWKTIGLRYIKSFGKTKEEVEIKKQANIYNI